ncbi:MAG: N-acetylmuramoyl-L-alanine amidase [Alphaproteobacteria bacterium]|nr:N-acetylmuramoyl-L-alanine amidase [Alphaproteobacteria bacterium]
MFLKKYESKSYNDRRDEKLPYILLMHYTGMKTMEAARERLNARNADVSAHYLIDEDGTTMKLVPEEKRAWHAGLSYWKKEQDINSVSIGLEIVNPGHEFGYRPFPQVQMDAVLKLSQEIMERYDIRYVLGHSDVAPERKEDPGELFDWKWLAENGVGLWPDPTPEEREKAIVVARNDFEVEKLFVAYGYNPMTAFIDVVTAFHRHYYPELFDEGDPGTVTEETVARLLSLIRLQKQQAELQPI